MRLSVSAQIAGQIAAGRAQNAGPPGAGFLVASRGAPRPLGGAGGCQGPELTTNRWESGIGRP